MRLTSPATFVRWSTIERMVGLGDVFTGLVVLNVMAIPNLTGTWVGQAMLAAIGLPSLFFKLPLLVTGRVRQTG